MDEATGDARKRELLGTVTEVAIRLVLLGGLVYWCFLIFEPFLYLVVLGIVLAVALHPLFSRVESLLGGRRKLAGGLFILVGVGALVVAAATLSGSFLDGLAWLSEQQQQDALLLPAPPARVAEWPLIGARVYEAWSSAAQNQGATLERLGPRIVDFGSWLLATLTGLGVAILLAIVAVVIAGVAMIYAPSGTRMAHGIAGRIAGEQGEASVDLAVDAIRSVATGVLGVATLQAILATIGLVLADVPAAGLWAVLVLILAVAQLPPLVVLGPAIVYVIATSDSTLTQVLFTLWSLLVSVSDAFLKPLFLGRGLAIPMPVILIGAIGGVMRAGILGLFVGAVVMAIGYKIFRAYMDQPKA